VTACAAIDLRKGVPIPRVTWYFIKLVTDGQLQTFGRNRKPKAVDWAAEIWGPHPGFEKSQLY
jgi:hypothetical protein